MILTVGIIRCAVRRLIGVVVGLVVRVIRVIRIVGISGIVLGGVFSKSAVGNAEHQNAGDHIAENQGEDRNAAKILAAGSCAELYVRDDRNGYRNSGDSDVVKCGYIVTIRKTADRG